jgi:hypothetical protein
MVLMVTPVTGAGPAYSLRSLEEVRCELVHISWLKARMALAPSRSAEGMADGKGHSARQATSDRNFARHYVKAPRTPPPKLNECSRKAATKNKINALATTTVLTLQPGVNVPAN